MPSIFEIALGLQLIVFIVIAFKKSKKFTFAYMGPLYLLWFIVLELVSGHITVAIHLLWLVPAVWLILVLYLTHHSSGTPNSAL
jgi:hypothetical protein